MNTRTKYKRGGEGLLFLLLKFPCIAAAAAEIFRGLSAAEAFHHGLRPGGVQNFRQFFLENIAQADHAVAV